MSLFQNKEIEIIGMNIDTPRIICKIPRVKKTVL